MQQVVRTWVARSAWFRVDAETQFATHVDVHSLLKRSWDMPWRPTGTHAGESVLQVKQVRKLGFREKDEYMKLEKQIEDATEEKEQLEAKIAETAQLGDFQAVAEMTEQLPVLSDKIDKMTDRCAPSRPVKYVDTAERRKRTRPLYPLMPTLWFCCRWLELAERAEIAGTV
jgi:hypothetical protein